MWEAGNLAVNWGNSQEEIQGGQADRWTFLEPEPRIKETGNDLEGKSVSWNMRVDLEIGWAQWEPGKAFQGIQTIDAVLSLEVKTWFQLFRSMVEERATSFRLCPERHPGCSK